MKITLKMLERARGGNAEAQSKIRAEVLASEAEAVMGWSHSERDEYLLRLISGAEIPSAALGFADLLDEMNADFLRCADCGEGIENFGAARADRKGNFLCGCATRLRERKSR